MHKPDLELTHDAVYDKASMLKQAGKVRVCVCVYLPKWLLSLVFVYVQYAAALELLKKRLEALQSDLAKLPPNPTTETQKRKVFRAKRNRPVEATAATQTTTTATETKAAATETTTEAAAPATTTPTITPTTTEATKTTAPIEASSTASQAQTQTQPPTDIQTAAQTEQKQEGRLGEENARSKGREERSAGRD